jgi:AcrR family transcriptional regulator
MSPRSEQQFLALREKSREKIMEAATELFAQQGFHGTSISAIAKAAGVSKGLMYNYFDSKENLLDAILLKGFEDIDGPMKQLLALKDPLDKLHGIVEATFSMVKNKQDRRHWQFMMSIMAQHEVMKRMQSFFTKYMKGYMAIFESIFKEMGAPNPKIESYRLAAMLDGVMLHYLSVFGKSYPLNEMKTEILHQYEIYRAK